MDPIGFCQCDETAIKKVNEFGIVVSDVQLIPPLEHNCYYVKLRNALIPRAEREAEFAARREWDRDHHGHRTPVPALLISEHFSRIMDRLVGRANAQARADVMNLGPERNRAFYANMRALIEDRRMRTPDAS